MRAKWRGDIAEGEELTYDRGMRSEEWMKRAGKSIVVKAGESSAGVGERREILPNAGCGYLHLFHLMHASA